jgi:hypothetical protein
VRSAPIIEGYPTAAVEQFTSVRLSRTALAADLLNQFEKWYLDKPLTEMSSAFAHRIEASNRLGSPI